MNSAAKDSATRHSTGDWRASNLSSHGISRGNTSASAKTPMIIDCVSSRLRT